MPGYVQLGKIYPRAKFWIFYCGPFCVSNEITWSYIDEDENTVLGDEFAGAFDCQSVLFADDRVEFEIAGGILSLYL